MGALLNVLSLTFNAFTGLPQQTFACSKLTIETLQKGVKSVQISLQRHHNNVRFSVFIVNFE